jgi:surface protein
VTFPLDTPNLDSITSLNYLLRDAVSFNGVMDHWDVSGVSYFISTFSGASSFDQALNSWDVSNALWMDQMFYNAISFNQPLSNWDVSGVTSMTLMFGNASTFNQPLNAWNVSNVQLMDGMFSNALAFNQSLASWDVSSVTTMRGMFNSAWVYNQSMSNWDVSSVIDMNRMFSYTNAFNQPLNTWDVSNVIDMSGMFWLADSFNQPLNNWDVSSVVDMHRMFRRAVNFNQDLHHWDYSTLAFPLNSNRSPLFEFVSRTSLSRARYDSLLIHFNRSIAWKGLRLDAEDLRYCVSLPARQNLISNGWLVLGDSLDCQAVGINEMQESSSFTFYPNPVNSILQFENTSIGERLQIMNLQGQVLEDKRILQSNFTEDLSEYENGIYMIRIGERVEKLIIRK